MYSGADRRDPSPMPKLGTPAPDTDPAILRTIVESRSSLEEAVRARERTVEYASAGLFLVAALALALFWDSGREFDPLLAAALVGLYVAATRIEFPMGYGWTDPSQLVLVPMLLLLPTQLVPLLVALALLISRLPEYLRAEVHVERSVLRLADATYSLWPALVLLAFGATGPQWSDWPVYLLALAAQFGCETAMTLARVTLALDANPRRLLGELGSIYLVDALLSPLGLLAAFAAADEPVAVLLLAPMLGLLVVFAREREARINNALALSAAYRGTAHLLGELLATTHEYTGSHSRSVVVLAHRVGQRLGLDEETLREIEFGALLHDVGKMAVPVELLNKPDKLSDEEMEQMRRHTAMGERMLERIGGVLGEVGTIVRSHHERWDGKGYPDGLRGEEIPIASRVIAACDAFNAMTTDRPYRPARSTEEAIAELRREAGGQFDPRVVEALIEVLEEGGAEPGPIDSDIDRLVVAMARQRGFR